MLSSDTFTSSATDVKIKCPSDVTGLERIFLTAQETVYSRTSPRTQPASVDYPIRQDRQVLLKCEDRTVCIATSTVMITDPHVEFLFLDEKYPIGQLFRKLQVTPEFSLLNVDCIYDADKSELHRTYKLATEGVTCTILEVFPDRDMFTYTRRSSATNTATPSTQAQQDPASLEVAAIKSFASADFWRHVPHDLASTPTLSSILDKQASHSDIGRRVFAAYPNFTDGDSPSYREVTYAEVADIVNYEASLWSDGLRAHVDGRTHSGEAPVIALLVDSGFDYAVTILSLLKLNVTVFLLAPANSEAAVKHLLNQCQVATLIYSQRHAPVALSAASDVGIPSVAYEDVKVYDYNDVVSGLLNAEQPQPLHGSAPQVPIIVHSSGSTSFPKPVRWSNASFLSNSQVLLSGGGWSVFTEPDNRFLCLGPLFHTMGLTIGLAGSICAGTTIVFPLTRSWPPSPSDIVNSFQTTEVKTCIIVPLLLDQLLGALEDTVGSLEPLSKLKLLITGGAHCPKALASRLISSGVNLKCIYGSSETGHMMVGSHDRSTANEQSWDLLQPFPHTAILFKPIENHDSGMTNIYQIHMSPNDVRLAPGTIKDVQETWNTGDVVQEVPAGSGWYRILYRDDDILVHVSGEKTNPIPMEIACRDHKLINQIAIVGHQRRVTAAIVELDEVHAQSYSESERVAIVHDLIEKANEAAPSHSRVLQEMVFIVPLGYHKKIPRTPKGNCIRPKVLQLFAEEIDALYRNFEDDSDSQQSSSWSSATFVDVQSQVVSLLEEIVGHHVKELDAEKSLFDMGLDSVKAMQLRIRLAKAFDTKLSQKFVYQNFSLSLLSSALYNCVASRNMTPVRVSTPQSMPSALSTRGEILQSLIDGQINILRNSADLVKSSRFANTASDAEVGQVVAVVGAAGSLGVWQVKALLDQPNVKQVVCLVRGDVAAIYTKMLKGFENANLKDLVQLCQDCRDNQLSQPGVPSVHLEQRLAVVPFDLANARFDQAEYHALASSVTTIIHTGWKMDFNQIVQGFEDCINGTTRLLMLAAFIRPKQFYFISSIGTVLESTESPVPETLPKWSKEDYVRASPHGYSESKFVCEYVIKAAAELLEIPCSIARIGQIAGDAISGVWKVQEMNPIIIAGSARIGKYPVVDGAIMDWIPVDVVGHTTTELALRSEPSAAVSIHHIVNPTLSTYADMVNQLREAGIDLTPVSPAEWWEAIKEDEGNPCHAIEDYIEEAVVEAHEKLEKTGGKSVTLDVSNTLSLSSAMSQCPSMDGQLWKRYVDYWRSINFL